MMKRTRRLFQRWKWPKNHRVGSLKAEQNQLVEEQKKRKIFREGRKSE